MSDNSSDLEALRRRLDAIDNRLLDLLIERIEIVSNVAETKRSNGAAAAHQPAREAEIIRRLVRRNHSFPAPTLIRMWRELLAATVRQQGAFAVAVYARPEAQGFWDMARDHYGSHTPMLPYRSTGQVIRAVTEAQAAVGVLPMPQEGDPDPWWRHLLSDRENAPHVIARLPFGPRGNARADAGDALAIGRAPERETGRDRTLFVTENAPDLSRGRMVSALAMVGLPCTLLAACDHAESINTLIEIDGFVTRGDPRLDRFRAQLGRSLYRLLRFGGYAMPLTVAELEPPQFSGFSSAPEDLVYGAAAGA